MSNVLLALACVWGCSGRDLAPGDHLRTLEVDGRTRSYFVHVPKDYDAEKPAPVVLIFHGAVINGAIMERYCGMDEKSDQAGFIAVYPNGTGPANLVLTFNSGGWQRNEREQAVDDVKFVDKLLDDLDTVLNVDSKRVFATGLSNGGMMCYRLASELSERIAAIAPVSGTMAVPEVRAKRGVPVLHFHGTADDIVPMDGPRPMARRIMDFKSVDETIRAWVQNNGCVPEPVIEALPDSSDDGMRVEKRTYRDKKNGADVVLIVIEGGGHTWPGRQVPVKFIGKSTRDISANDLIWEFFQKHPMK